GGHRQRGVLRYGSQYRGARGPHINARKSGCLEQCNPRGKRNRRAGAAAVCLGRGLQTRYSIHHAVPAERAAAARHKLGGGSRLSWFAKPAPLWFPKSQSSITWSIEQHQFAAAVCELRRSLLRE